MNEINQLSAVLWSAPSSESALLKDHGLHHRFGGVDEAPPDNHLPSRQEHGIQIIEVLSAYHFKTDDSNRQSSRIESNSPDRPFADGQISSTPGQVVVVKTADCLPILFADINHTVVAAIHGGWRGLTGGILRETVAAFTKRGVGPRQILVAIGPAISRENYEVGMDVLQAALAPQFGLTPVGAALSIAKGRGDRWQFDLSVAAALHLLVLGIDPQHIEVIKACTFNDHRWNSFRRNRHTNGLNWSHISL
jgi:YfiH family protein